ncbi:MAG: hypothetical protein WC715_04860 [Patescibacteria group bacterium]|jgi:tRNA A37 threonylcarbamoyladenosine modification protein TsaB
MKLYINTIKNDSTKIEIGIFKDGKKIAGKEVRARYAQAEKLLPLIDKMFADKRLAAKARKGKKPGVKIIKGKPGLKDIKEIAVANKGGSFTSLRIGVVTANALGYALGIRVRGVREGEIEEGGKRNTGARKFKPDGKTNKPKSKKIHIVKAEYGKEPNITFKNS